MVLALSVDTLDTSPLQGLVFVAWYKQARLLRAGLLRGLLTPGRLGSSLPHNMCGGKGLTLNLKIFFKFLNNSPCHSSSAANRHVCLLISKKNGFLRVNLLFYSSKPRAERPLQNLPKLVPSPNQPQIRIRIRTWGLAKLNP